MHRRRSCHLLDYIHTTTVHPVVLELSLLTGSMFREVKLPCTAVLVGDTNLLAVIGAPPRVHIVITTGENPSRGTLTHIIEHRRRSLCGRADALSTVAVPLLCDSCTTKTMGSG